MINNKPQTKKWFVYIIECEDNSLYTGATNDLKRRFSEHIMGKGSKYVRARKAKQIIYSEEYSNKYEAFKRERELKGFSRQKKLDLIKLNQA